MKKIDLLEAINAKKQQVLDLVNEDKLEEAKTAKAELQTMQDKLDLMEGISVEDNTTITKEQEVIPMTQNRDAVHEFADAARHHFANTASEGSASDGGYTVPQDIQTKINKYKEAKFSLRSLVSVENVTTMKGRRIFQTKATHTGFAKVSEAGKIGAKATPTFSPIDYEIEKYAGYLPATDELLADSDANITNVLTEWLAEEEVATENAQILALINPGTTGTDFSSNVIDKIKDALNVTLGQAYAAGAAIVTNDDGFNYLDKLKVKDINGNDTNEYLLKPAQDQSAAIPYTLAVGARKVPVVVVPNQVFASTVSGSDTYVPFVVGDLKEAIAYFDRQKLTITTSNTASVNVSDGEGGTTVLSAFESDLTMFRGIMRMDVVSRDANAIVKGFVKL